MKTISITFAMTFLVTICAVAQEQNESPPDTSNSSDPSGPQITNNRTNEPVDVETLVKELAREDVIFLGEQHDNDSGHEFQLDVIKGLVELGVDLAISTEQFERDVQGVVDDYLADRITEEQFLEHSRPWKNYEQHYRPIVELAKSKRIPVLAANIPRRLATDVSAKRPVSIADVVFLPRSTTAPKDAYWQKFMESMKGHGGTENEEKMLGFYAAQCLKDDAMAESITDFLAVNPHQRKVVVHLCGHFHSDYGLGTAARVLQRRPLTKICVITMESIPDDGKRDSVAATARGHYVFWAEKNDAGGESAQAGSAN